MGRMDRYHSSNKEKKNQNQPSSNGDKPIEDLNYDYNQTHFENEFESSRYEEKQRNYSQEPPVRPSYEKNEEQGPPPQDESGKFNGKKNKKRKKRGKFRTFLKVLLVVLILIIGYSIFGYFKGYFAAKNDTTIQAVKVDTFNGEKADDGSVNILLLGSDSRGEDQGRSDTIMIAHYSKKTKKIQLVSFMRDLYVNIPEVGYNKINAAYSYGGPELVRQTITNTFGIKIQYYAIVNFNSFPKIIDVLMPSGVEIDAEKEIDLDGVHINPGVQKMDGNTLLQYARFRMDEEGDFGRVRRQQQVMNAVSSQLISPTAILHLPEAAGTVMGYTSTNLPTTMIAKLGIGMVSSKSGGIGRFTVPNNETGAWWYGSYDVGSVLEFDENVYPSAVQNFLQ